MDGCGNVLGTIGRCFAKHFRPELLNLLVPKLMKRSHAHEQSLASARAFGRNDPRLSHKKRFHEADGASYSEIGTMVAIGMLENDEICNAAQYIGIDY